MRALLRKIIDVFASYRFRAMIQASASSNNSMCAEGVVKIPSFVRSSCGLVFVLCAGVLAAAEPPTISINDVSVSEGNHGVVVAVFTVSLSDASSDEVTVRYSTADGTAKAEVDYLPAAGIVSIPAGELSAQIIVMIRSNMSPNEKRSFSVRLSAPQSAVLERATGSGVILDDDLSVEGGQ